MANVRVDKNTGIWYTYHNIPLGKGTGKSGALTSIQNKKGFYKIMSMSHKHPDDCWYHDTFCGDYYAVFKWVSTGVEIGFYQQVTKWYSRFGWTKRRMLEIAQEV